MMIPEPSHAELLHVCRNLRAKSREEIFGIFDGTVEDLARGFRGRGVQWVGYHAGRPAAILGAFPEHPGVWSMYGFGTDDWIKIWRAVTRTALRDLMPDIRARGAHRIHSLTLSDHKDTHRWIGLLGATHETPMPAYGKEGQDYTMFAWVKED